MARMKKAQGGNTIKFQNRATRSPFPWSKKTPIEDVVDTTGYAGGRKMFKGTAELMRNKPGKSNRKVGTTVPRVALERNAKKAGINLKKRSGGKISKKK